MKLTRLMLCGVLTVLSATATQAGPLRNLAARVFHPFQHGGCGGGCGSAPQAAPQYQPAAMPATGQTVHLTSYTLTADGVQAVPMAGWQPYQPIRVGRWLPTTCGPNGCGR